MQELPSSESINCRFSLEDVLPGADLKTVELQLGLKVSSLSCRSAQDVQTTAYIDDASVHFICLVRGSVDVACGKNRDFKLGSGNLFTCFAPGERFRLLLPSDHCSVELVISVEKLLLLSGHDYQRIEKDIGHGLCVYQNQGSRRVSEAALRLARLIADDDSSPLFLHAAALDFLAWHLATFRSISHRDSLSIQNRRQLMAARERLLRDLSNPPTIAELAREIGLNQLKLKRGFKALFGQSIYALFLQERMNHARVMLRQHGVTETAMRLGYSNPSHFSHIFSKQFGFRPRDIRRGIAD